MDDKGSDLQSRCAWLRTGSTFLTCCFVLALVIDALLAFKSEDLADYLTVMVPYRLPVLFYLAGAWSIRNTFARLARGELFGEVLPIFLHRLGWWLVGGGLASVFFTQWLLQALLGPGRGAWATFDPAAITIALVGSLLIVLSDLMERAANMQQELDEFF